MTNKKEAKDDVVALFGGAQILKLYTRPQTSKLGPCTVLLGIVQGELEGFAGEQLHACSLIFTNGQLIIQLLGSKEMEGFNMLMNQQILERL